MRKVVMVLSAIGVVVAAGLVLDLVMTGIVPDARG